MKILLRLLSTALLVMIFSYLMKGVVVDKITTALTVAIVLALLNFIVKPLLIILTLPLTIVTLGLFLLIINVIIILLADKFVDGIKIDGFLWAFIFGLLLSVVSSLLHQTKKSRD